MATYLSKLATKPGSSKMDLKFCESLNISMCTPSESGEFTVMIYNPLGRSWSGMVRLPLIDESVSISGPDGSAVQSQVSTKTKCTFNFSLWLHCNIIQCCIYYWAVSCD
jgi:lysosomal alpha-mannosidase